MFSTVFNSQLAANCAARLYIRKAKSVVRVAEAPEEVDEGSEEDPTIGGSCAGASAAKKCKKAALRTRSA